MKRSMTHASHLMTGASGHHTLRHKQIWVSFWNFVTDGDIGNFNFRESNDNLVDKRMRGRNGQAVAVLIDGGHSAPTTHPLFLAEDVDLSVCRIVSH